MVNKWLNKDIYLYNHEKGFRVSQGEKAPPIYFIGERPRATKSKTNKFCHKL
jgi:hypothetical protein